MSAPPTMLDLRYQWRTPVIVASMAMLFCLALLARNRPPGSESAVVAVIAVWLLFLVVVWRRTRAQLGTDGDVLVVRTFRRTHRVAGGDVLAVRETLTPSGALHRLTVRDRDGSTRRIAVPTAMVHRGHSTLFAWILSEAGQAELDRGSRATLADLRHRGLLPPEPGRTDGDDPPPPGGTAPRTARPRQERARRG